MEFEKEIEVISKLGTISDKLKYYNDNISLLIGLDITFHEVGFGIGREQHNIFCLCEQCKVKFTISDFETYRDIRNQETQKVVDFFESKIDYKTKIEYYFKISEGFSTTLRTLFFVPDKISEIDIHKYPYKVFTIDITPKNEAERIVLKNHIKQKLLTHESRVYISLAQFTYEKRVEAIEKYLEIRTEKSRREELIQSEYDKISLSKVDRNSPKPYDKTSLRILNVVEKIIQGKHNEFYTDFSKLEITILAEDTIKYEQYLNNLSDAKPDSSDLKHPISDELEQIDSNLWSWIKNYENMKGFVSIPLAIETKADYVIDTYKNYEERNFKYQLEICKIILDKEPNEEVIIEVKNKYIKKIKDLRKQIPLPYVSIKTLILDINSAFYRLRIFMEGGDLNYKYYHFNDAFTLFFNELNKLENVTFENHIIRDGFFGLMIQFQYEYKNGNFKNENAYKNDDFNRDYNEIEYIITYRISESITPQSDQKFETKLSITDLVDTENQNPKNNFVDKILESKEILLKHNIDTSTKVDKEKTHLYKVIIDILKHPSDILVEDDDAYLGKDENGIEMYKGTGNRDKYDEIKNIKEPFSNLESLTIELMNNTKHQKVLDGYLKLIFREFMETAVIIIDYCNEYLYDSPKKSKSYPKDLEYFFYTYKLSLERYYDFIVEFMDVDFLNKENKIFIIDGLSYQTTTFPNIQIEKQNDIIKNENKKEKKLPEKWYALLYLLELKATNSKPPTNFEGSFVRSEIEEIGSKRTGSTGQNFYRQTLIINDVINNNSLLVGMFNNKWKETIIKLSNSDKIVIDYLEKNY